MRNTINIIDEKYNKYYKYKNIKVENMYKIGKIETNYSDILASQS